MPKSMMTKSTKYRKKKTIPFNFSQKHIDYIRSCVDCTYNIAEGAVRAGKTIDNVFAFAHELMTCKDKLHLATGSTAANAKLNIGDANGFGLEYIFRGQCRWGKFKDNDCLIIQGVKTNYKQKVVIFAGASKANSFAKIRGNSYGMWIATEINLHHDNTIKEAFNRTVASHNRKFFWDLNPDNPKAKIYTDYIDKYIDNDKNGKLIGGVNYKHFTIFDNVNISDQNRDSVISQYEKGTIWYNRDILGVRCVAEGLIFRSFADAINSDNNIFSLDNYLKQKSEIEKKEIKELPKSEYFNVVIGVDFGGNESGHSFVATAITPQFKNIIILKSERHLSKDIDPDKLGELFVLFVNEVYKQTGKINHIFCDSAEQVLIRGLQSSLKKAGLHWMSELIDIAAKISINNRINLSATLLAQGRLFYDTKDAKTFEIAMSSCVWSNKDPTKDERLDNGTSDIDTMDAFEYTIERFTKALSSAGKGA